jgi:uncharacterized protein YbjQ (UPF0145 family)
MKELFVAVAPNPSNITAKADPITAPMKSEFMNDLHVFLSPGPYLGPQIVVRDFGMITATHVAYKKAMYRGLPEFMSNVAAEAEMARAAAMSELRRKATLIGANGVINLKFEMEQEKYHTVHNVQQNGDVTLIVAIGSAVLFDAPPLQMQSNGYLHSLPPYYALPQIVER